MRGSEQRKKPQRTAETHAPSFLEPAKAPRAPFRPHAIRIFIIWAFALLAYSNSFQSRMVFDNAFIIGQDIRIQEVTVSNLKLILTRDYWFGRVGTVYRPVTTLSYLFNYAVLGNGLNPASYHWVNFALHAVNIALVYLLVLLLLKEVPLAFAAAAMWAVHPVLTESVTNIVGRADLLAALGILAGLLCHVQAAAHQGRRRKAWLAALALAATLAIFSKEVGVVLLAAMAIYDFIFRPGPAWRTRIAGYIAAGLPVAIFIAVRAWVISSLPPNPIGFVDNPLVAADFWTSRLTAIEVLMRYVGLLVWPLRLSCDYSYNQVPLAGWGDWKALVSLAACLAMALAAVAFWRRSRPACYFIAFFFAALAPTANLLFPVGTIMAERFLYLPAIAMAGCAVLACNWAGRRWTRIRSLGPVLLGLVCALLAVRTWARNADWASNLTLWSSAAEAAANSYKTHHGLAESLSDAGANRETGRREADRALAILSSLPNERSDAGPYANAGHWYRVEGDALTSAEQKAAWYHRALDVLERGRSIDRGRARQLGRPVGTSEVYLELGRTYQRLSQQREAFEALEYGRQVAQSDQLCEELAGLYQQNGEFERAAVTYLEALSLDPSRTALALKLVELYRQMDPRGCSLANGTLNLDCPLVRQHVCASARNVAELYRDSGSGPSADKVQSQAMRNFGCPAEFFRSPGGAHAQ